MIVDDMTILDTDLQAIYERRSDEYNQPPTRLVERLVYATYEEAKISFDNIEKGTNTFEDAVEMRGLELQDVDLGDVTEIDFRYCGISSLFIDRARPCWTPGDRFGASNISHKCTSGWKHPNL
jgi:peptidyl-prolyl cis-trans isomerase D